MQGRNPEISVVIPALNEEKYIRHALSGLRNQSFKNFETIVVDGNSNDKTRKIAGKYARVIIEKGRGIGRARNAGARIAKGKLLLFLDADTKPTSNLLSVYSKAFKNSDIVAATGPILPLEKTNRRIAFGYKFVSMFFVRLTIAFRRPYIVGSNFAVKKEAFDKVHGFNKELMSYEDWDLSVRLKKCGRVSYISRAMVHTSARRVMEWGISGYFIYYASTMIMHSLFKKAKKEYNPVR